MRIVHYYPRALVGDGGVTNSMRAWVTALSDAGAAVKILHMGGEPNWTPPNGVQDAAVPHKGGVRTRRTLRPAGLGQALEKGDLLVLHSGWWLHNLVAASAARDAGIPYVLVPHGAYDRNIRSRRRHLKAIWEPAEARMVRGAAAVHLFFESEISHLKEIAPNTRTMVVPTGHAPSDWRWHGGGGGYLAWLGRFDIENKGLDLLIAALAELPESERPRLRIAGTPFRNTSGELVELSRAHGIEKLVEITGPIYGDKKVEFLQECEAYVYPSRWENYGMSVVEALAAGVPTVISGSMHIAEFVRDAAVLSDPSPAPLAAAITTSLHDRELLSKAGPELVARKLDWGPLARRWLQEAEPLAAQAEAIR